MHAYLRPVVISIAPLKLPIFQQDNAARSKQPNAAFCSCGVGWDIIKYVTHEHTCTVNNVKQLQFFSKAQAENRIFGANGFSIRHQPKNQNLIWL